MLTPDHEEMGFDSIVVNWVGSLTVCRSLVTVESTEGRFEFPGIDDIAYVFVRMLDILIDIIN